MKKIIILFTDNYKEYIPCRLIPEVICNHADTVESIKLNNHLVLSTDLLCLDMDFREQGYDTYLCKNEKCIKISSIGSNSKTFLCGCYTSDLEATSLCIMDLLTEELKKEVFSVIAKSGFEVGVFDNYETALKIAQVCNGQIKSSWKGFLITDN